MVDQFRVGARYADRAAGEVAFVRGDGAGGVLADQVPQLVVGVGDGLAERGGAGGQLSGRVVGVGDGAVVEVCFGYQTAGRIVLVTPGQALGVDDLNQA